jgi:hypothetical protein
VAGSGIDGDEDALLVLPEDPDWVPPPEPSDEELAGCWPDPLAGPPDGADAWLADLTSEQRDDLARELAAARPTVPESIGAGFTHRYAARGIAAGERGWEDMRYAPRPAGPALGFAAGAAFDVASPDPMLATFAQEVLDDGLAQVTDDELIGLLCAARRMASWQAATELVVAAELDARRRAAAARDAKVSSEVSEHVAAELAAAPPRSRQKVVPTAAWAWRRSRKRHDTPEQASGISALTRVIGGKLCGWTRPLLTCSAARAGLLSDWRGRAGICAWPSTLIRPAPGLTLRTCLGVSCSATCGRWTAAS